MSNNSDVFGARPMIFVYPTLGLFCACGSFDVKRNEDGSVTCAGCNTTAATPELAASPITFNF